MVRLYGLILVLGAVWLRGQQLQQAGKPATPNESATTGPYSLRGTVVNGTTGEPVPRALVRLNSGVPKVALSGPDGRFEFDSLPEMSTIVMAQKPGFYTPQELGQFGSSYSVIQVSKQSGDLKVNLYPCTSITGRVVNTAGDPIEGIQVRALYQRVFNGETRMQENGSAITDDTGTYRIANLVPGKYYVATDGRSARILSPQVRPFNQSYDQVYPALYYPNSPDRAGATVLEALPGQPAQADFTEDVRKAYTIRGSLASGSPDQVALWLSDREGERVSARMEYKNGTFRFSTVLPGEYFVVAQAFRDRNSGFFGSTPVAVNNSDVDGVSVEVSSLASIDVHFSWEGPAPGSPSGSTPVPSMQLHLSPEVRGRTTNERWSSTTVRNGQSLPVLEHVFPGSYRVTVMGNLQNSAGARIYVASVRSGQTDLTQNKLIVTPGAPPAPIEVVFRAAAATVTGTIKGASGVPAFVVVVPDSESPMEYSPVSASDNFTISGLAPGGYHLYAFPSVDGLEYRNRQALQKFENRSVGISVSENETKQVELELIGGQ
jgi:hypothetical protein